MHKAIARTEVVYLDHYTCDGDRCRATLEGSIMNPHPDFKKFGWSAIEGLCCHTAGPCNVHEADTLHFCSERCKQSARGKWTKIPPPEPTLVEKLNNQTETIQKLQAREKELELKIVSISRENTSLQSLSKTQQATIKKLDERIMQARTMLLPLH